MNALSIRAALAVLSVALLAVAACNPGATPAASSTRPSQAAPTPAGTTAKAGCPTKQPAALPAGQKRLVSITTAKGKIDVTVEGALSPIAAGNFVALASCGFYNGVVFHRLVPGFVIQGGDPKGNGTGGPGYEIQDEPVTAQYHRGVVAMARTQAPNSQGSQFFIVLSDAAARSLVASNNYAIFGEVTSGMDTVDLIAAMPNSGSATGNTALQPVAMDSVTVKEVP